MKKIMLFVLVALMVGCASDDTATKPNRAVLAPAGTVAASACPNVDVNGFICTNHTGSEITFDGDVSWDGLQIQFIFRNNVKGTHERKEVQYTAVLVDAGTLTFDKEPVRGGVGGNPHVWYVLLDGNGNPLTDEAYLGRCVQDGGN